MLANIVFETYFEVVLISFGTSGFKLSMDCFKAGAMVGTRAVSAVLNGGRVKADGLTGSLITGSGIGSSSTILVAGFSGSIGLTFECWER